MSPISLRLRELRDAQGLTQQALADRAGVSRSLIARIETDSLRNVTLETVERLADALGVNAAVLIDHRPGPRRKR